MDLAVEVAARIGQVEITDLALDRQGGEIPFVDVQVGREFVDIEVAGARVEAERALGFLVLREQRRGHRPVVVEFDAERDAAAIGVDRVEVLLHEGPVVDRQVVGRIGVGQGVGPAFQRVVDIAAVADIIGHHADRDTFAERRVEEALDAAADTALAELVEIEIISGRELARIGFVGDQADRAGERTGAVERALRSRQRLDAGQVIGVDVEHRADRRDRDLVDIDADRRQRTAGQVDAAGRDATDRDVRLRRAVGLEADARQQLGIVVEIADLVLREGLGAQRLEADRYLLDALAALRRGDDDLAVIGGIGGGSLGESGARGDEAGRSEENGCDAADGMELSRFHRGPRYCY